MKLTNSQSRAVDRIFERYLNKNPENKIVDFKAPTGSGKTFMATSIISKIARYINYQTDKKVMFIVATVSDAELPKSFAKKINQYKKYLDFNAFDVEFRQSPSTSQTKQFEYIKEFFVEHNKVLVFGTSSFGKNKLFTENKILHNFIEEVKNKQDFELIYIRDEAHRSKGEQTNTENYQDLDSNLITVADFVLRMTATPKKSEYLIELSIEDMKQDEQYLLKNTLIRPSFDNDNNDEFYVLKQAIKTFKKIKEEYKKLNINVNPAMLIQVRSKESDTNPNIKKAKEIEFENSINKIINILKSEGLNYLKYFSNDKVSSNLVVPPTLEEASKNNSLFDVIIFKVGPATGWDIPRACMLVQLRKVSSEQLNIQTVGRIKRNPYPNLEINPITDKYYLYSDYQESTRLLHSYKIKPKFEKLVLASGTIDKKSVLKNNEEIILKQLEKWLTKPTDFNNDYKYNLNKNYLEIPNTTQKYLTGDQGRNKIIVSEYFTNIIKLKIFILEYFKNNFNFFSKNVIKKLKLLCITKKWNFDYIIYTLINDHHHKIKDILNSSWTQARNDEKYHLENKHKIPNFYQTWSDTGQKNMINNIGTHSNYGYELIVDSIHLNSNVQNLDPNAIYKKTQKLYLDSAPEVMFIKKLIQYAKKQNLLDSIQIFAKLPTFRSKVKFEYFSKENNRYKESYMDFVIKTKNNNQYFIEVKSENNDYNPEKTKDLTEAYKKYLENSHNNKIYLLIAKIKEKKVHILDPTKSSKNLELSTFIDYVKNKEIFDSFLETVKQYFVNDMKKQDPNFSLENSDNWDESIVNKVYKDSLIKMLTNKYEENLDLLNSFIDDNKINNISKLYEILKIKTFSVYKNHNYLLFTELLKKN